MSEPEAAKRQFHTLDMLRGLAALSVVGLHLGGAWVKLLPGSHLAVDLFFALSGFVIAHAYAGRLASGLSAAAFMRIRLIRLYPLYLLGSCIGIAFACIASLVGKPGDAGALAWVGAIGLTAVFLPAPFFNDFHLYPFNFPAWSLLSELLINLLYAAVAPRLTRGLLAAFLMIGVGLALASAWQFGGLDGGSNIHNWPSGPERVVYSFFVGIALYRLWSSGRLAWWRLPPWLAAVILLAVFALRPWGPAPVYDATAALIVFPALVLGATAEPGPAWQSSFARLGVASYAIYALHIPLVKFEQAAVFRLGTVSTPLLFAIETAFIIALFCAALAADRWIDRPARRWLNARRASTRDRATSSSG